MSQTWFSPFPRISRGGNEAREELANLDKDISYLGSIVSDLKEERQKARDTKSQNPTAEPRSETHSDYLTIIENLRRAENELNNLFVERLTLVLRADLGYEVDMRGDHFPHPTAEEAAKEFIQRHKDRLVAVSTIAFFGSGITFSAILSGTRGSIGLMSCAWAAFTVSFSVCVFLQYANPETIPFTIIAYPQRRTFRYLIIFFAGFASFVGILFMGMTVALLNLRNYNSANQIDTRINTSWGGIVSVFIVGSGFGYGVINMLFHAYHEAQIRRRRSG